MSATPSVPSWPVLRYLAVRPCSLAEIHAAGERLGLDLMVSPWLAPYALECLLRPLPSGWTTVSAEEAEGSGPYFAHKDTGRTSFVNPAEYAVHTQFRHDTDTGAVEALRVQWAGPPNQQWSGNRVGQSPPSDGDPEAFSSDAEAASEHLEARRRRLEDPSLADLFNEEDLDPPLGPADPGEAWRTLAPRIVDVRRFCVAAQHLGIRVRSGVEYQLLTHALRYIDPASLPGPRWRVRIKEEEDAVEFCSPATGLTSHTHPCAEDEIRGAVERDREAMQADPTSVLGARALARYIAFAENPHGKIGFYDMKTCGRLHRLPAFGHEFAGRIQRMLRRGKDGNTGTGPHSTLRALLEQARAGVARAGEASAWWSSEDASHARDAVAELRQSASPEDVRLVQEAAEWLRRYDAVAGPEPTRQRMEQRKQTMIWRVSRRDDVVSRFNACRARIQSLRALEWQDAKVLVGLNGRLIDGNEVFPAFEAAVMTQHEALVLLASLKGPEFQLREADIDRAETLVEQLEKRLDKTEHLAIEERLSRERAEAKARKEKEEVEEAERLERERRARERAQKQRAAEAQAKQERIRKEQEEYSLLEEQKKRAQLLKSRQDTIRAEREKLQRELEELSKKRKKRNKAARSAELAPFETMSPTVATPARQQALHPREQAPLGKQESKLVEQAEVLDAKLQASAGQLQQQERAVARLEEGIRRSAEVEAEESEERRRRHERQEMRLRALRRAKEEVVAKERETVDVDQDDTEVEQHEREQAKDQLRRYRGDVWDAVASDDVKVLRCFFLTQNTRALLARRCKQQSDGGRTLLHRAAWAGACRVAEYLLRLGHPVDEVDTAYSHTSPLLEAARAGHTAMVKLLLRHDADVKWRDATGRTAAHWAASRGWSGTLRALVAIEATQPGAAAFLLNTTTDKGLTPEDVAKSGSVRDCLVRLAQQYGSPRRTSRRRRMAHKRRGYDRKEPNRSTSPEPAQPAT